MCGSKRCRKRVFLESRWLEYSDYPLLLGAADLGVCLHTSSSGLDLPMKVVDMFGCGLPVCAAEFNCIGELVVDEQNGLVFESEMQLEEKLQALLKDFPRNQERLTELRRGVEESQSVCWEENWKKCAKPVILSCYVCVNKQRIVTLQCLLKRERYAEPKSHPHEP